MKKYLPFLLLLLGITLSCKKEEKTPDVIPVTSISLSQTSLSLTEGEFQVLTAVVRPSDATYKTVVWASSVASVASVDDNGNVIAISEGNTVISARAGGKIASCAVTVSKKVIAVTGITLNKTSLSLTEGDTETLVATVTPADATDKTVTWTSSSPDVATVDGGGKVTAKAEGTATVTAKAGDKTASCSVTVSKKVIAVTGITLNKTTLALTEGDTETLVATVAPEDATDKAVTWASSSPDVATVDDSGKVTARAEGTATVTAKAGDKTASCSVTVSKKVIAVTGITLNKTALSLTEGDTETLVATVAPEDATDRTVTWASSSPDVATVDDSGKVTAKSGGTATITAKAGDNVATCAVTVTTDSAIGGSEGTGEEDWD